MRSLKNLVSLLLLFGVLPVGGGASAQERVRVSYSSRSYAFLAAYVAQANNFFRDEKLEVELIQMRPGTSSPALYNGDVHATLTFGSTVAAIISGFPFKIVAVLTAKPIHYLVARPEIRTVQDLRGKKLGVSQLLGTDEFAARAILEALEMQRQVGIDVYTDGELRRGSWLTDMAEAVEGFVPTRVPLRSCGRGGGKEASTAHGGAGGGEEV